MNKLALNLDDLTVESFSTTPEDGGDQQGTINGNNATDNDGDTQCDIGGGGPSADFGCFDTDAYSCGGSGCGACETDFGCDTGQRTCIDQYPNMCDFSDATNCHRC